MNARKYLFALKGRTLYTVGQGKPNRIRVSYAEALRTHRVAATAARSAREGRLLSVPGEGGA